MEGEKSGIGGMVVVQILLVLSVTILLWSGSSVILKEGCNLVFNNHTLRNLSMNEQL